MSETLQQLGGAAFCYLTTSGRVTGRAHTIEIWFVLVGQTVYMLSGGRAEADWVKNLLRQPQVRVRLGDTSYAGLARVVADAAEDALARRLVLEKYQSGYGEDLADWGRDSLAVAVDLAL